MAEDPKDKNLDPTGDGPSPDPADKVPGTPAPPELTPEEQALEELETAAPEDRPAKRASLQKRFSEITSGRREAEERARNLELENATLKGRLEGVKPPEEKPPDDLHIPEPTYPPPPRKGDFEDESGYVDEEKFLEARLDHRDKCAEIRFDHKQRVAQVQAERQNLHQQISSFLDKVAAQHTDFVQLTKSGPKPSLHVGGALMGLNQANPEAAVKVAYHLAKTPAELNRLNGLAPMQVALEIGDLSRRLSLPDVQPKKISDAPPPTDSPKGTEKKETFNPETAPMEDYGRHHPATAKLPWLK